MNPFGDLLIEYVDGTTERLANASVEIDDNWFHIAGRRDDQGQWHEPRHLPAARVREVRRWDKYGWHDSYEKVMALSPEEMMAAMQGPIMVAKPQEEGA